MRAFQIVIGKKGSVRLSFSAMARSSCEAVEQHLDLAQEGERVEAFPELSQAEANAADLLEDIGKGERRFGVSYRCAVEDQVQRLRNEGAL